MVRSVALIIRFRQPSTGQHAMMPPRQAYNAHRITPKRRLNVQPSRVIANGLSVESEPSVHINRLACDVLHGRKEYGKPAHVLRCLCTALRNQRQLMTRP